MFDSIKGTLLHEGLHLIQFWRKMYHSPAIQETSEKIKYGTNRRQYFLLLKGRAANTPEKVVVYYHGGAWTFGAPEMFKKMSKVFLDKNYWFILPSHRQFPFSSYKDMRIDSEMAMLKIIDVLKNSGLSKTPIVLGGMSSGAHLASLFALDNQRQTEIGFPKQSLRGLFLFGAPLNLKVFKPSPLLYLLARGNVKHPQYNPLNYLRSKQDLNIYIVHGEKDGLSPLRNVVSFLDQSQKHEIKSIEYLFKQNGSHLDVLEWIFKANHERKRLLDFIERC